MKKFPLFFIAGMALLFTPAPAFSAAQEGIAAVVNDSVITITDITDRTSLYLSSAPQNSSPEARKNMEQQVLSKLIDEALQIQEAQKLGITIGSEDVKAGFDEISRQNGISSEEFKKRLTQAGAPVNSLYNQIKADIAWSQVVRRKLRPQVNISESEIDLTLNQITHGNSKPRYQVAEIFLNIPSPEKDADTLGEAGKLVRQLTEGASFADVAHEFSQAPGAANGGDLGWVQEGQLDPELDKAIQKMHPGQISPPIRSARGYHILFLRDVRQNAALTNTAVKTAAEGPIISMKQIFIPVTKKDPPAVVAAKIARGKSLKKTINSCKAMDARMKDFPSPNTGSLGKGPQNALPKDIIAMIEHLKIGELSDPIRNPFGIAVMMLCSREESPVTTEAQNTPPAKTDSGKDADASRETIANNLGMKRLDQMALRYLRDLRATAFIDKRI